jgi:ribosomal protein S18 acetylase RimI-like enzyme
MIAHCHPQPVPSAVITVHRLDQKVDGNTESLFIAFLHGSFAGSAVGKIMEWNACSIRALFVAPHDRRMGVATRLLAEIERWAVSQKVDRIECCVMKGNGAARNFWIRKGRFIDDLGRQAEGERAAEYVVMYRELQP